ncbi:MAG: HAMP domain-containing histidine kinase, partial [Methanomassiliicoccales archaeon]|nr:HAMP domain-containing histidine kinase [Methanomassiliicoccales archaeon]
VTPSFIEVGREVEAIARSVPSDLIKIHNDLGQEKMLADPLFHKVVYNIVENAVRHGGGATHIRFRSEVDGRCLKIICEDDGMGLTKEDKEQIFARGVGKNTGEGLFLIRHILSMTGMTIREEGRPDEGARFVITVPEGHWQK